MSRYLKIGLFAIGITAATGVFVSRIDTTLADRNAYEVVAYIDDASGLFVDSIVRLAGVDVGRITAIELEGQRARLTLALRNEVEIREDVQLTKVTSSLLGTSALAIQPGSGQGALIGAGGEIRSVQSTADISAAVGSANELASEAVQLVRTLNELAGDKEAVGALREIIFLARESAVSTADLLEQNLLLARATMESARSFAAQMDTTADEQLVHLAAALEATAGTMERIERLVARTDPEISRGIHEVNHSLELLQEVLVSLQGGAEHVEEISRRVRDGEGSVGRLLGEDDLYERVVRITSQAEEFLDSTVGLGVQLDFRSELLMNQLATRNRADLRLTPARDDRFYSFGAASAPVSQRRQVTTTERQVSGTGGTGTLPEETVTRETVRTNDLLLNLQLARIWGPLTVRAGVFESTAGVGVDLQPLDRLVLSAEAYNFGGDNGAYLRASGGILPFFDPDSSNPLHWLYLSGGIDDILGTYRRDFFLGAGVRFTDSDIRGLVGFVPVN